MYAKSYYSHLIQEPYCLRMDNSPSTQAQASLLCIHVLRYDIWFLMDRLEKIQLTFVHCDGIFRSRSPHISRGLPQVFASSMASAVDLSGPCCLRPYARPFLKYFYYLILRAWFFNSIFSAWRCIRVVDVFTAMVVISISGRMNSHLARDATEFDRIRNKSMIGPVFIRSDQLRAHEGDSGFLDAKCFIQWIQRP